LRQDVGNQTIVFCGHEHSNLPPHGFEESHQRAGG
jgi:hypothetical protein